MAGKLGHGGVKGKSGRKKLPSTLIEEALASIDADMPAIFHKLKEKALLGDKDCLIYLIDRRMGRPHQSIDQRIKGFVLFTADDYKLAIDIAEEEDRKLLKEGTDAIQEQGTG